MRGFTLAKIMLVWAVREIPTHWKEQIMRVFRWKTLPIAAGLLLSVLSIGLFAQDPSSQQDKNKATTMTGCLSKDATGAYLLTDETSGAKTTVTGAADLEKYSSNHKVTLTGTSKMDANGKPIFEATKLQNVSSTCKAPSQ